MNSTECKCGSTYVVVCPHCCEYTQTWKWISAEVDTPNVETLGGKEILVLVNDKVFLCTVMNRSTHGMGEAYFTHNNFLYSEQDGWCCDPRFAKPTHWMPLPKTQEQ